jgi:putative ABC transport system permease protein
VTPGREAVFVTDGFTGHGNASRWAVRTTGDPARLTSAVRAELTRMDPLIPMAELQPMSAFVDKAMAQTRFSLVLIAIFGGIAAVLAAVGLYGVLSTLVRQRTAEIGVRMAFGAPSQSIFRLMIGYGLRLSAVGVAIGVLAAIGLTQFMRKMLVEVKPNDPVTFVVMAALFVAIAGVACWVPARRAAGVDPGIALREE